MIDDTSCHPRSPSPPATAGRRPPGGAARALPAVLVPLLGAAALAGCSTSGLFGSGDAAAPPPAAAASTTAPEGGGSFTSRVTSLFSGATPKLAAAPAAADKPGEPATIDCPGVEYRQGAATWSVNANTSAADGDNGNGALSLRYLASFTQTARECIVSGRNLTIKVGVQGRIVVGPAGASGSVNVPLRYALVREGLRPQTLWTKLFTVPVTINDGQLNVGWLHVEEEMTVPRPSPEELDAYAIYVGFDPDGAAPARPARPARPKTARGRE